MTYHFDKNKASANKGLPKAGVMSFYYSFVLNRTLVFQINGSAEMPRLRQAPNRYQQGEADTQQKSCKLPTHGQSQKFATHLLWLTHK